MAGHTAAAMTERSLIYLVAFAKSPDNTVYREQAKLLIASIVEFGEWKGKILVFTNLFDRPLSKELPAPVADHVDEKIVLFEDFSHGLDGKLPSCLFRMESETVLSMLPRDWVLYLDTDIIVRRPLSLLIETAKKQDADWMAAEVKGRCVGTSEWFKGHITHEYEAEASKHRGIQGGSILFRAEHFHEMCNAWRDIYKGPARDDVAKHVITDQSALNLAWILCHLGRLPWKMGRWPVSQVAGATKGQRAAVGHAAINGAVLWHWWGGLSQEDRVTAMASELDRLRAVKAHGGTLPAPAGLVDGVWTMVKPKERLVARWTFQKDGLVIVHDGGICGRWEWRAPERKIMVDWLWGWEEIEVPGPDAPTPLFGRSFRNGWFSLTRAA